MRYFLLNKLFNAHTYIVIHQTIKNSNYFEVRFYSYFDFHLVQELFKGKKIEQNCLTEKHLQTIQTQYIV